MDPTISWRMKKRMMRKQYADAVIQELQKKGYPGNEAKKVFYCHYRYMKREFGFEANPDEFAALIDEFERSSREKYDPNNPNHIYVGHLVIVPSSGVKLH